MQISPNRQIILRHFWPGSPLDPADPIFSLEGDPPLISLAASGFFAIFGKNPAFADDVLP
jgi:hypothetical protein